MKKTVCIIVAVLLLSSFTVKAETADYNDNYDSFIGNRLDGLIDEDTKEKLSENGINPENSDWINNISVKGVFSFLISLFKGELKKPFAAFGAIACSVLLLSAFTAFGKKTSAPAASLAATAAIALIIVTDVYSCVTAATSGIKLCSGFMIGFIPAFAAVTAASGRALTAAASSGILLLSAQAVSSFAAYGVLPLMGGYLGISITSGISPPVSKLELAGTIKKITLWGLSLISTVFLGVLSVQTAVNSAADSVSMKATKFILGTSVPIAGTVLSEAASAVSSSISFLKSSIGIYAVLVIIVILLPVLCDILLWRGCFMLGGTLASFFGQSKISALLKAVDSVLACLLGIILLVAALFIISLTVLISAGRGV